MSTNMENSNMYNVIFRFIIYINFILYKLSQQIINVFILYTYILKNYLKAGEYLLL